MQSVCLQVKKEKLYVIECISGAGREQDTLASVEVEAFILAGVVTQKRHQL